MPVSNFYATQTPTPFKIPISNGSGQLDPGWIPGTSGTVTSVALTMPSGFSVGGSPITTSGTLAVTTTLSGVLKGNGSGFLVATPGTDYVTPGVVTTSGLTMATARLLGRSTAATGAIEEITLGTGLSFTGTTLNATGSGGTVTSVAVSGGTTGLTTSGGPITTSGTITLAGTLIVANGGTGVASLTAYAPIFGGTTSTGAVQSGTVGTSGQVLTSNGPGVLPTFQAPSGGSGTVASVAMTVPSFLSVSGSPITTTGTLAVTLATQSANLVFSGPTTGGATTPTFRALVAADLPAGAGSPLTTKGDVYGFSTVNARIPVGIDGQVLIADSTQTLGLKWGSSASGAGGSNTQIQYNSTGALTGSAVMTFDGTAMIISANVNNSTLRVGGLEIQAFATNNDAFLDNIFYDGSNNKYRVTGFGSGLQYNSGQIWLRTAPSGTAGATATLTTWFTMLNGGESTFANATDSSSSTSASSLRTSGGFSCAKKGFFGDNINVNGTITLPGSWVVTGATSTFTVAGGGSNQSINLTPNGTGGVVIPGNINASTLRVGVLEIQSFATNNCAFADNVYFDGTNNKYRTTGYGSYIQFNTGQILFRSAPSGSGGANATVTTWITMANTGESTFANATDSTSSTSNSSLKTSGGFSCAKAGFFGAPVVVKNYTVATLPSAATYGYGIAFVTDSVATAIAGLGLAPVGGGSNKVPVYSDLTNWLVI